ncbi:hypothetical protein DRO28_00310 [Candidatus Bathyarchaeota archaeon]|nr:MAG: hypothetical protein DRO28_00310 [Candidatus Bathyarchaeota archaeon]
MGSKMETLEIKSPTKKVKVFLVEKEYDESISELRHNLEESKPKLLQRPSPSFQRFLRRFILNNKPHFATEELGERTKEEFYQSPLAKIFRELKIPFFPVDIDDYAKSYLLSEIDELKEQLNSTLKRIKEMENQKVQNENLEYLTEYVRYLEYEIEHKSEQIDREVRVNWIAKGIIDSSEKVAKDSEDELVGIHICSPSYMTLLEKKLDALGVYVRQVKVKYSYSFEGKDYHDIRSINVKVKPIIKSSKRLPYILFFLNTDEIASPFDVCMAYDAGFDVVNTYNNVSVDLAKRLVQDAMFSRGPKGIKRTCFFIGGRDVEKVEKVASTVKDTMMSPFKTSVIVDPRGAYTTAAAMVAKAEEALRKKGFKDLSDKSCAVFGTGPVGRIASVLLSKLGCKTFIVSLVSGQAYVANVANNINRKYSVFVKGVFAPTKAERLKIMLDSDVVFTAVAPGTKIVDGDMLDKLNIPKLFIDVNAVPPYTIERLQPKDELKELKPGVYGIGALVVGDLKYRTEMELLRRARLSGGGFYDFNYCFNLAREILKEKELLPEISVTLRRI